MSRQDLLALLIDVHSGDRPPEILTPQLAKRLFEEITRVQIRGRGHNASH